MGLFLVLVSCYASAHAFAESISTDTPVLLVDLECEFAPRNSPNISVVHTDTIPAECLERVLVVNRLHSYAETPVDLQKRLNFLQGLVYRGKTVYALSEYRYRGMQKDIMFAEYVERMVEAENIVLFSG
ncbi:uncharacterized protein NEMAJ01_2282 [Nematocida major]|uniref:uncharacterized protein n=1 Tax=Nematocida major TaxID=1912982 RepID=UPI002008D98B|nr:uncharacterized protein NEMAJ01_2282 [Nematocida major]KAH9387386.1 hypothetical protein NEMAJ01_2282 [Nematocida major]